MRPQICRLCEKPAINGGIRGNELDKTKFAEWCVNYLDTDLASELQDTDLVCSICVADASLQWWPQIYMEKDQSSLQEKCDADKDQQKEVQLPQSTITSVEGNDSEQIPAEKMKEECVYCGKICMGDIVEHVKMTHADIAIRCDYSKQCAKYFHTLLDREIHVKFFHLMQKVCGCIYCSWCGITTDELKDHVTKNHRNIAFICAYKHCEDYFKTQDELVKHIKTTHHTMNCLLCDFTTSNRGHLMQHNAKEHTEQSNFLKCPECPSGFACSKSLYLHVKNNHSFKRCPACKVTCNAKAFSQHTKSVSCKKCGAQFTCSNSMANHKSENKCSAIFL
ncbi:putative zinc finger protein 727 isoform X2 [Neocloeon triangulifer]|uniref:putative zinc finger protein 727 isoform X2 n=1 Tax=Neocloeon triangulifer TaxID=2078957 RepID=UPI00286EC71A|nr:putative zinc finger protein 727 isoform X2 [Neocloeon triangulifer]